MRRITLACVVVALAIPSLATSQLLTTKLYNFVDTKLSVTYGTSGAAQLKINASAAIIPVAGYRKVSIAIGTTHATTVRVYMGKITGATLSQIIFTGAVNQNIHTFDVIGPDLLITLSGAPANSTEQIQVWVFLTT